jgi:hypothetical protein
LRRAEREGTIAKLVAQEYNRKSGGYYSMDCRQKSGRREDEGWRWSRSRGKLVEELLLLPGDIGGGVLRIYKSDEE